MWYHQTVLLLVAWACLADVSHTEDLMKPFVSVSKSASLRSRRMVGGYAGGALISDRWILTAGRNLFVNKSRQHIQGKNPIVPKVYLGISQRAEADEVAVEKVVLHPGFQNQSDWDNDLALIKLKKPVVMSDKVTPIPLPERGQDLPNTVGGLGVIAGWGWGILLTPAKSLKYLKLSLANHSHCKAEYEHISFTPAVDDNMFCTENTAYEENVCFGDAGGALAVTDADTGDIYAAGILSYDKACNRYKHAVYMKISSYLPWIHSVIRGDTEKSAALRSKAMSKMYSWQPSKAPGSGL
uniref:Peptidase S1 domain-containing protein n=1 Tax=Anabas testudineus TaxID=64144 RepID=A0A7N5ZVR2_ANATE